jgi:hypothetical protein
LSKQATKFLASYTYLILHPRYFIHHTYLYSLNASLLAAIIYLAVAIMLGKRSRVNALEIATTSKRLKASRPRGTARQPVPVNTQPSPPSSPSPPLSSRQALVAASHKYWAELQDRYPNLSKFAINMLSIPGSSCECERMFSELGDLLEPRRRNISPQLLAAIQCNRRWIRAGFSASKVPVKDFITDEEMDAKYGVHKWDCR